VFANPQHPYTQALLQSTISLTTQRLHSIPGAPPDLVRPPSGCRFHPRCPYAMEVCVSRFPPLIEVGTQQAECWLLTSEPDDGSRRPLPRQEVAVADEA
jgi:oligopeptide/dipeptide ABC transporter ATP-binding protein